MRITEAILRRGDFGFLGLIGSKTKRQRFIHRFERRGIAPEVIRRMTCPIGVEGISGKQPELIAVAVVAQLLQRTGGEGAGIQRATDDKRFAPKRSYVFISKASRCLHALCHDLIYNTRSHFTMVLQGEAAALFQ